MTDSLFQCTSCGALHHTDGVCDSCGGDLQEIA